MDTPFHKADCSASRCLISVTYDYSPAIVSKRLTGQYRTGPGTGVNMAGEQKQLSDDEFIARMRAEGEAFRARALSFRQRPQPGGMKPHR